MELRFKESPTIDNLRHYPDEVVGHLRHVLEEGAMARPDPRRKNFYDVENGSRVFFIHIAPSGKVLLLATWAKEPLCVPDPCPEFEAQARCCRA